jgi:glycosyltransferase involved in cell wall biosynthesis
MDMNSAEHRHLQVRQYERERAVLMSPHESIAVGFAWRAANVGGVWRHFEGLEKYSSLPIALYPSPYAGEMLPPGPERDVFRREFDQAMLQWHALFHSHVDPRFIRLSRLAQQMGKPWVHTYHALYFAEDWEGQLNPRQEEINDCLVNEARHADVCLAINSWLVEWLDENHGIKSALLPNGVDVEDCDKALAGRFIETYGISDFVLFVGGMARVKNPLAFVKVAKMLPNRLFVMVGSNLTRGEIEEAFAIDVPDNLRALGPLPHNLTLDAIAACSSLVMTSHREGVPTVLLEAMAMKKPCVVPDAPWFSDVVQNDSQGLKYRPGHLDELAEMIEIALDSGPFTGAREQVEKKFAWPVVAAELDTLYKKLLG